MKTEVYMHNSEVRADEPAWKDVNIAELPQEAFAFVGRPAKSTTWGYPHHWIRDGKLFLHRERLETAWKDANGGDVSRAAPQALKHLAEHRSTLGLPDAVKPDEAKFAELRDVEVFEAGQRLGMNFSEADLDTIVANWKSHADEGLHPPLVLGHGEGQDLLKDSGLPAAGWVSGLRRAGRKLLADFRSVPETVARLIASAAYRKRSVELYRDYGGNGLTLRRVALLGAELPEIKTLADVETVYLEETGTPDDVITVTSAVGEEPCSQPDDANEELVMIRHELQAYRESEQKRAAAERIESAKIKALDLCRRFGLGTAKLDEMAALIAGGGPMKFAEGERDGGDVAWETLHYIADSANRVCAGELAGEYGSVDIRAGEPVPGGIPRDEDGDRKTAWCLAHMSGNPGTSFAQAFRRGAERGWE
ncbi:MAG TPA: hypothetical protein PL033_12260 [Candidatus Brocadiia bacterium]|nr:hypothetical protein [Candidatus Brocadiia bacterium]